MPQIQFYRYADETEAENIERTGMIAPRPGQACKWYTPNRFDSGADARRFLALPYTSTRRIGPIPESDIPPFDHAPLRVVGVAYRQPGGGLEAATTQPLYLFTIARIP